jgi:hypothetical protein
MPRIVNYPSQELLTNPRTNEREFDASVLESMIDEQKDHQGIIAPAFQINAIFDDNDAADTYYDWCCENLSGKWLWHEARMRLPENKKLAVLPPHMRRPKYRTLTWVYFHSESDLAFFRLRWGDEMRNPLEPGQVLFNDRNRFVFLQASIEANRHHRDFIISHLGE